LPFIRARKVSCVEVMTAYLDHIEKLNPRVNPSWICKIERRCLLSPKSETGKLHARVDGPCMLPLAVKT